MFKRFAILSLLCFQLPNPAYSNERTLSDTMLVEGRSIPHMCRLIYHIETDFRFRWVLGGFKTTNTPTVQYRFLDIYSQTWTDWKSKPFEGQDVLSFTEVTFSTQDHFLYHEIEVRFLADAQGEPIMTGRFNFHFLMNRCYPEGRAITPFQEIGRMEPGITQ